EAKAETAPETEVFYTFTWGRARPSTPRAKQGERSGGARPQGGNTKGKGRKPKGKRDEGPKGGQGGKTFSARPPKSEKPIDPDNPFAAALMGLKGKT
ncbi:MAG: disulfide oxidoreductase, partial [Sedimentitalea sp.]